MRYKNKYLVATRPSLLATTQTEQTLDLLRAKFPDIVFEAVKISTHGDNVTDKPLTAFGGTGVFVKELELAIERGEADFAIHSLKDMPGEQPSGFVLAAFPKREDPRDVLLTRNNIPLSDLPDDCVIGTSSPRRLVQLAQLKPGALFRDIRGNVDTRMKKLEDGEYDAIVLAAAGLKRLGKHIPEQAFLPVETCLPAVGQGIIGIECLASDVNTIELLRHINNTETEITAIAERQFMRTIGGGCKFPLAAHAVISADSITLRVLLGNHITKQQIVRFGSSSLEKAEELGGIMAQQIKAEAESLGINFNI